MIGTLLNSRYRIDAQLGEGGMGVVYRAHDSLLERAVAIKALSPQLISHEGLKRLLREAQAAAKLSHPGIVATHDVIEIGDDRYIVMEFVEGTTMRERIPMPWREAVPIMRQVFEAIQFAHERGIVHRDLKPENIIITPAGTPKIMDFGLARSEGRSRLTQTGLVVGTALYMAPEQALQGKAVAQSDLYALGCVFYELLTGRPPFTGEDSLAIVTQHINLAPRSPRHDTPEIPPGLEALVLRLLAKDPGERPATAADVVRMLSLMEAPSTVHAAIQPGPALDRFRGSRLVGRTDVLGHLLERLDRLTAGTGGVIAVSGEPGIGKTRLMNEIIAAARLRGFHVISGRSHERDVGIPYLPIADALEDFARTCPPARWEELLKAAGPELILLLSDTVSKHLHSSTTFTADASALVQTMQTSVRPARALRNLLAELSHERPVLFVIDDLHWADPPSLELMRILAAYTREIPVLIFGSYREIELERTHPLSTLLVDLNRERLLTRERLRRLSVTETAEMLRGLLGGEIPPGLAELVHEQTDGNPFFIEELTNGLVEAGRLVWHDNQDGYQIRRGVSVEQLAGEIPQGIRAAIGARLDRLDATTQQTLSLASVVGRQFALEVLNTLAAAHGLTEEDVDRALAEAQSARFVAPLEDRTMRRDIAGFTAGSPETEADYAFDHPLIHQVVYAEIDRRRKRRLHAEVGYLLERLYHGREGLYSERLAYHFLESDDDGKALEYCTRAGDKMLRAFYDPDLALGYYLQALEMVIGKEPALRHFASRSPIPIRRGTAYRFTSEEREIVVSYLGEILQAVRDTPAARAVAQLGTRICTAAMHLGPTYEASVRLFEQSILGPDVQKIVVDTPHGKLVGILEFPGPGGPYPVVMILHGSGGGKESVAETARPYLARGMASLRVDLPGFGETTVPASATLRDALVLKEMISTVLAHERVDPRGIGIAGWSLSPWHGAQLCARDNRVRAMVSISGMFNPHDPRPGTVVPEEILKARFEAAWRAGKRPSPERLQWAPDTSVYDVADQIRCPMLLVYGALEPEMYRAQAEELAALVPTAKTRPWRSGVHVLLNVPEAFEEAADWMKEQLR